jgi:hypothetical protein
MRKTGQAHHRAKVSDETVRRMRYMRERRGMSYRQIGQAVGCSMWTARDICDYRTRPL